MIPAGYQIANITIAAYCFINTVNSARCENDSFDGDYEAMASKKGPNRHSDSVNMPEFVQQLQGKVRGDPSKNDGYWSCHDEAGHE